MSREAVQIALQHAIGGEAELVGDGQFKDGDLWYLAAGRSDDGKGDLCVATLILPNVDSVGVDAGSDGESATRATVGRMCLPPQGADSPSAAVLQGRSNALLVSASLERPESGAAVTLEHSDQSEVTLTPSYEAARTGADDLWIAATAVELKAEDDVIDLRGGEK